MPKAKISKLFLLITVFFVSNGASHVHAQPVIGQVIEQAKKNKLLEMFPPAPLPVALPIAITPSTFNMPQFQAPQSPPALWSLSGVNERLLAEVLINEQIQSFKVARGVRLADGWTVVAGDESSLTLKQKEKIITLFPPALGTSGAEFPDLKRIKKYEADGSPMQAYSAPRFSQPEFISSPSVSQGQPANLDTARQAASSLPKRP